MLATIHSWTGEYSEPEPREISWDEIKAFFDKGYDVAIWHTIEQRATRKKKEIEGIPAVLLDEKGKHFRQR